MDQPTQTPPDEGYRRLSGPDRRFVRRTLLALGISLLILLVLLLIWYAVHVLLMIFAGVLLGLLLRGLAGLLSQHAPISSFWALVVVLAVIIGLSFLAGWLVAPRISAQVDVLMQRLPKAYHQVIGYLKQFGWGEWLLAQLPATDEVTLGSEAVTRAKNILYGIGNAVVTIVIVLFVGLYVAVQPRLYRDGLVRLVPPAFRPRATDVLDEVTNTLQWWLIGRIASMAIIGVATTIGLWLMGIPLALTLGFVAALLTFIPNFGPVISAVPAVLLGLLQGPQAALWVVLLYIGIQTVESYLITPLIQMQAVRLPPVLIIAAQVLLGVLAGALGLILATPLTAAVFVLVKRLYIEDVLGDCLKA